MKNTLNASPFYIGLVIIDLCRYANPNEGFPILLLQAHLDAVRCSFYMSIKQGRIKIDRVVMKRAIGEGF